MDQLELEAILKAGNIPDIAMYSLVTKTPAMAACRTREALLEADVFSMLLDIKMFKHGTCPETSQDTPKSQHTVGLCMLQSQEASQSIHMDEINTCLWVVDM